MFCRGFDPESIPLADVSAVHESLARMEKLVAGARLRLAARVEASHEWRQTGHRRAADWLAQVSGTTAGAAQAELDASARLARSPVVDDALRRGALSVTQAATITDAAAVDPAAESRLVAAAATMSRRGLRDQLWTFTEIDHRVAWGDTHHTTLTELDRLCRHDHRLKTHHGWALVTGTGTRPMVPPDHPDHSDHPSRAGPDPP